MTQCDEAADALAGDSARLSELAAERSAVSIYRSGGQAMLDRDYDPALHSYPKLCLQWDRVQQARERLAAMTGTAREQCDAEVGVEQAESDYEIIWNRHHKAMAEQAAARAALRATPEYQAEKRARADAYAVKLLQWKKLDRPEHMWRWLFDHSPPHIRQLYRDTEQPPPRVKRRQRDRRRDGRKRATTFGRPFNKESSRATK